MFATSTVAAASPAAKAKISIGWTLVKVEKTAVQNAQEISAAILEHRGQKGVRLYFRKQAGEGCPACDAPRDGTEHMLLECDAYAKARHSVFGTHHPPLSVLRESPWLVA